MKWRTHVGKDEDVVFRPCASCAKSTEGLCHCDKAYCWEHMKKHLATCEIAQKEAR